MKALLLVPLVAMVGCSSTRTVMTNPNGDVIEISDKRFLVKTDKKDNSVIRENDGSFLVEWKSDKEGGDVDSINAIAWRRRGNISGGTGGVLAPNTDRIASLVLRWSLRRNGAKAEAMALAIGGHHRSGKTQANGKQSAKCATSIVSSLSTSWRRSGFSI